MFELITRDIIHHILEYIGTIKYKDGKYINIIHKYDIRYTNLGEIIDKKIEILKNAHIINNETTGHHFFFEFGFSNSNDLMGLSYDYRFNDFGKFEICYYDFRCGILQLRTYI